MKSLFSAFALLFVAISTSAAAEPLAVTQVADKFRVAMQKTEEPQRNLNANYERRLKALKQEMSEAGSLEKMLLVQSEIDNYLKKDRPKIPPKAPELRTAREKYEGAMRKIVETEKKRKGEILLAYEVKLRSMIAAYTKERKIDDGIATRNRLKEIESDLIAYKSAATADPGKSAGSGTGNELKTMTVGGCRMTSTPGGYLLNGVAGEGGYMQTIDQFRVPVSIRTRVATDSTNIRIYFAKGFFVLNGAASSTELRIHDPATGAKATIPGKGGVSAKAMHDIEWAIHHGGMSIKVDDRIIYQNNQKYSALNSTVGIGPAHGSQLIVNQFTVEER